jgi:UrcA family protein
LNRKSGRRNPVIAIMRKGLIMTGLNIRPLVRAVAALALLSSTLPVMAQSTHFSGKVVVPTSDIDLSAPKGARTLERRVNNAVNSLCGQPVFGTRDEADALDACRADAHASAEPQVKATLASARVRVATAN